MLTDYDSLKLDQYHTLSDHECEIQEMRNKMHDAAGDLVSAKRWIREELDGHNFSFSEQLAIDGIKKITDKAIKQLANI